MSDVTQEQKQANKALQLARFIISQISLFVDQYGVAYAWLDSDEVAKGSAIPLRSRLFKSILVRTLAEEAETLVGSDIVNTIITLLEADARQFEPRHLWLRYATGEYNSGEKYIAIDMANGDMLVITKEGINIEKVEIPIWRRYPSSWTYQIKATEEGRKVLDQMFDLWNLGEGNKCLLCGFLGASMVPDIPHAILSVVGPQGAAKTTLTSTIREVLDPSRIESTPLPKSIDDLLILISHNYVTPLDNVSRLTEEQIDALCRSSTGAASVKRELYTDQEEVILDISHVVIMNSVTDPTRRGDYIDRLLRIELKRLPFHERKTDAEMKEIISALLPKVRYVLAKALSEAMRHVDSIREELNRQGGLPRMADFALWGEAVCRALGFGANEFYRLYKERISDTQKRAVEADEIAQVIVRLVDMCKDNTWEGSPSELLKMVKMVNEQYAVVPEKLLPQSPEGLMRKVNMLSTDLLDAEGIEVFSKRTDKKRVVVIRKLPDRSLDTTFNSGNDGNLPPPVDSPAKEVGKMPSLPSLASSSDDESKLEGHDAKHDGNDGTKMPSSVASCQNDADETNRHDGNDANDGIFPTFRGSQEPPNPSINTTAKSENAVQLPRPVPGTILTVCIRCGRMQPCIWYGQGQDRHAICEDCFSKEIKGGLKHSG